MRVSTLSLRAGGLGLMIGLASAALAARPEGMVKVDGSSTVGPLMMAAAELFGDEQENVQVTVGISGTGGGFKKFLEKQADLRTDISNASRPISKSELDRARELGVEFIELPVAYDGIAVVVNPKADFVDYLTVEELKRIWAPDSKIKNWKDVREGFPDLPLKLFGPGPDSGTFDYFTEAICGKARASRSDYNASENDNILVQGVSGDRGGLGYFGFAYYQSNKTRLKALAIESAPGRRVQPTVESIRGGEYSPLARAEFIYVNRDAVERPEVSAFLNFFFANARSIAEHPRVNHVALSEELYKVVQGRLQEKTTGTVFSGQTHGKPLSELYLHAATP